MFSKGPRFPPVKPSDVPGPGHYKVPEESRNESYKKGAFLEKADRFSAEKGSDVPGPGTYNTARRESNSRAGPSKPPPPNHGLTHFQQELESLKSQNTRLQKEHQQAARKYEDKLTHAESTIRSLVKDNVSLQTQVSTQQKDCRMICQREGALRAALEKAESSLKTQTDHARKFAALQRRQEEIEKLHADDNKKNQNETEHLRGELEASRRAITEQSERSSILRKQLETSESRVKDLKKAIIGDQADIKELRTKLRDAEQAKTQGGSHQAELEQTKQILQSLQIRHKAELNDREAKFTQQEKTLITERRRREALELQVREAQSQAKEGDDRYGQLKTELETVRRLADEAGSAASDDTVQLNNLRTTMTHVAEAYGNLATSSISRTAYRHLQLQHASLQLRTIRLERRLADREALAEQLTDYCRQATEEKTILASVLQDAERDFGDVMRERILFDQATSSMDMSLIHAALHVIEEDRQLRDTVSQSDIQSAKALASLYQTEFEDLLVAYAAAHQEGAEQGAVATRLVETCSELQAGVDAVRSDYRTAEAAVSRQREQITEGVALLRASEERLADLQRESVRLEEGLKKERELNGRLVHAAHQSKKNEEILRFEVDSLVEELQDVARYKDAHSDLLAEVVELIQRNELAEAEAEQLSKFNAEILGHTNPQQKIFYVDRIRRELADTKHQLMKSTRSRDDLMADNAALQNEVAAYKSIAVPVEYKPRVDRLRVKRMPLVARNINGFEQDIAFELTPPAEEQIDTSPMTLDEIM